MAISTPLDRFRQHKWAQHGGHFDKHCEACSELQAGALVEKVENRTIDITPTWRVLLPVLVEVAANGTSAEGRKIARDELYKLADAVDAMNAAAAKKG